jgi:PAS domain S-box-containing protein
MMRAAWKPIAIVTGLLLVLTYLLVQSRSPDLALRQRMHETLQSFALHDAELTRDVLLARAGLLPNYDSLVSTSQNLVSDLEALRNESLTASDHSARALLGQHVRVLEAAALEKLSSIEYFKSDNALLRNSLMYLTHAQALVRMKLDTEKAVAQEMGRLSHSLLRFMQTPESGAGDDIRTMLDRLYAMTTTDAQFQILVTHGRFIVNNLPQVDAVLGQIITSATVAHARTLQEAVLQYSERVEARAQVFRFLLYLVAVTLLGYLILQFLRLRASAAELRRTNLTLSREMVEREQAELALRASEERLRAITDSAKEAIVSADSAGNIVSWSAGASAVFGYESQEVLDTPFVRLIPERAQAAYIRAFAEWVATSRSQLFDGTTESTGLRKDGTVFPIEISMSTWSTQQGRHITAIVRDITERRRLEETTRQQELQLIQANKMTALGTLVSSVAHEINNPNQLVLMNSRVLAEAWDDALGILDDYRERSGEFPLSGLPYAEMRQSISTLVRDVHDGALRIERIVQELKDFARPRAKGARAVFELSDAVQRASRLLAHLISKRTARFRSDLASDLPLLRGDAQQIEQIVVNLLVNALEALPDRERAVSIRTLYDGDARHVVLEVRDEGMGIPREHLARLCDPFFTTKQDSGGTGLGLAITASLVRAHGARLDFESEPNRGTRARVVFPLLEDEVASSSAISA